MPTIFLNKNQYASNGGKEMVLTQTQYDNLTEQDKMNGMTYYICDADSDKNGDFQPVIYNTSEREIGVWCDGKPLYQKTIVLTGTYYGSTDIGNINISSPDTIIIISCAGLYYDNTWRALNFSHPDSNNAASIFIKSDGAIAIRCGSSVTSQYPYSKIILNLQYTKTTDAPGSGSWTPSGTPTVHYDDNEKVVGTWFGETLYEISTICDVSASSGTWNVADFNVNMDDINEITEVKGAFCRTQDKWTVALNYYESSNSWSTHNIEKNATTGKASLNYKSYAGAGKVYVTLRYTKSTS